jgi:NAD-dependent deacetylase
MSQAISERGLEALFRARRPVVLTGAGVSAESGVPTFRGPGGLWRNFRPEELATPEAFRANPGLVWEFYEWRRGVIRKVSPNPAHQAIAALEDRFPSFALLTQNIDGLHRGAGSRRILELHGNIWQVRCVKEGQVIEERRVPLSPLPPRCECGELLRPNVVWFGEALDPGVLSEGFALAASCDFMLVAGTSSVVQPAASFPLLARRNGAYVLEVNAEPTPLSDFADESLIGKAGEILPGILARLDLQRSAEGP